MRGEVFATPRGRALTAILTRKAEQIEVPAPHEADASPHQPDRAVAQVMRLPRAGSGNARRAEKALRDAAICLAGEPAIERSERENQPSTSLYGQEHGGSLRSTADKPPKPERRVGANREVRIQWDERRNWSCGSGRAEKHCWQTIEPLTKDHKGTFRSAPLK